MLPPGAYVTLEHEFILILRKGDKRAFPGHDEKLNRARSSYFWEERNIWFSDVWDFKGTTQVLNEKNVRDRSAAFPFELAYRLVNMFSVKGDTVLDPFLGTGTTLLAAMASCRNSIGVEINQDFNPVICSRVQNVMPQLNDIIRDRLEKHLKFVHEYEKTGKKLKHRNLHYNFPVMTRQEVELIIPYLKTISSSDNAFVTEYLEEAILKKA